MNFPSFTAELSLGKSTQIYRGRYGHSSPLGFYSDSTASVLPNQFEGMESQEDDGNIEELDDGGEEYDMLESADNSTELEETGEEQEVVEEIGED